jgi:hypothetical protein
VNAYAAEIVAETTLHVLANGGVERLPGTLQNFGDLGCERFARGW